MPVEFKSKSLKKDIILMLKKHENANLEFEDLESITSISLDNLLDYYNDYDLKELVLLKNIKKLYLKDFIIDDSVINVLNKLQSLEDLTIEFCEFENCQYALNSLSLNTLTINACENFKAEILNNTNLEFIFIKNNKIEKEILDFTDLGLMSNLKSMYINGFKLKNIDCLNQNAPSIEELNIDGSIADEQEILKLKDNIDISHKEEYKPIL